MNNDNLKRVYQTLIDNGYTPPQYEQFEKEMEDDNNLQGVYNTLKKEGYTPPSYDVFKSDMGFGATETQQPAANDTAAVAEPATDETQIPSVTAEKTPGSYAWRLNVVNQPGKNPYQSRTYGSVYDEIISDYGKNLAKADGDPFAEARASIIQAGITDDTKPEEAESLALNIRHGYANKYAGNASKEMVSALPDQVPNVDSLIDGLWYTRDMQNRVNHEASRLGLRKENYVNYYMKPQLAKALSDRYGYDVESAKRIAGRLLSQDEHTNEVIRQNEAMNVVSQYAAPIIEGEFKKIQEAADREAAPTMLNLNGTPEQKFLASVKNWQATDPETVWQNLKPMFDNMGSWTGIVGNEQLFNQISQMAEAEQIPVNAYIDKYVIPSYANAVQKEFERIAVEREMPKDTYEYIVKKMGESLIGNIGKWMLASEARRRAQGEAMQLTDTGQGKYKPGFGAKVAGGAAVMLPDMVMPFGGPFGFTAKVATKPLGGVAQLLITSGTRPLLARITQASLSGSASLGAFEGLKGAIEGGITPTGYEHLLAEDKRSAGDILLDVLKGGFERGIPSAVTGATMIGGPIGQKISNGRGLLANLAGWGTQVGVDAGLATAINIPKVVSGAITADDLKDEFFENIGTFAALGLHSKGKEFSNLASGGRSINGVEFTKPEIESIEDRYLMPLRDVINEIDKAQSKRSLITKSRLGIDEAQEKRDAITEVGTEIFNDMLYSYGVPADLKVKVCTAFNLPVPENALKPKVLETTDKVVSDVVSEGFDNKVNQDYNKPGGVLDKLKKGESLSDYELTLRLLMQDNKRYNEIGEKIKAGEQLTEDEMAFVNQYNSRIDSIQAKMFSQELDRMASDFEKRNDLKKGTIKRMLADLKAGKGVEDAYMLDKFESELNEYSKILDEVKNARSQEDVTESPIDEAIDIPTETPTGEAAVETPDTTAGAETVIEPATADEAAPQMDRSELADKLTNGKTGTIMEVMLNDGRKAYVIDGVLSNEYGRVMLADENGDVITMTDGNGYTFKQLPVDLLARDEAGNIIVNEQTVGEYLGGNAEDTEAKAPAVKDNLTTDQSAMSRIPVTDGVHQFEQAKPEDTLAALRESLDTPEELSETIDEQISDLTNELQQLTEAPKGKNKKVLTMDEKLQKKSAIKELQKRIDYWNSVKELLNANEVKPEEPITEQPVTDGEAITEPAVEPVTESVAEPSAEISAQVEQPIAETPAEPIQPTKNAKQVVYETTVNNNVGKRYEITDKKGVRSEITIDGISEDGKVMITRQDIDKQGKPLGNSRQQSVSIDRMGKALIEGSMTPAKTTDDKLRIAFKNRPAMQNLINVLNETEAADLYSAYLDGDADRVSELFNELSETHKEDMVLQERDNRNSNIEKIMSGPGNREDKLRRVRDQYKGYSDAEEMLSDDAIQPTTLEEYIAEIHSRVPAKGEGPIAYNSYETADGHKIVGLQDETGYGTKSGADTKGFKPWLAPKGKGMSLAKYAEQIHSQLPEAVQEQYSDQDVRNALLEVFGGAERPSDIPLMNIRRGIMQAEQAARLMEDMVIDGNISYQKVHQRFAQRLEDAVMRTNENPTEGQKKAGNYKKGHISFGGYHYTVENPAGSMRRGTDANGNAWETEMHNTYGYILGKKGKDGDHLDMFINDKADLDNWDGTVYVVDQVDPETGRFDEHKVMYGFGSEAEARDAYLSNYSRGWQGLGKITGVDKATFDKWLDSSDRKQKEFADHSIVKHKLESQVKNFDSALEKLDERGISIDNPELLKAYGLRNVILSRTGDHVSLTHFIANEPGQGSGTRFMEDLARLADEKGWTLALTPDTSFGASSMSALKRFYNRFGFKPNKGRYTDFETNESMVRRPKEWTPDTPEYQEQVLRDVIIDHLRESGVEVSTNLKEGQRILDRYTGADNTSIALQKRIDSLSNAEKFIEDSLKGKKVNKRYEIELPSDTRKMIRQEMGQDYDSHNIYANGMVHSKKNHGENGVKIDDNSIPLRDEDFKLAPHIMVAPDRVVEGSMGPDGRTSIRFEKDLSNGVVLVVEKEQKNSPDDMDTITMWAEKSIGGADARNNTSPVIDVQNVISDIDAAKIRKDSETAIKNDEKISYFKTPDGQAYGYTYRGKIYIDPRIATAETPIHEFSHLWVQMKRETSPDEWNSIKQTLLGDKLVEPFIEKVKRDYPELAAEGKEDSFVEEVLTQFSGKHGVEKLRKMAEEIKQELGGDAAAETIAQTAIRRVRSILNDFWKGVCNMMGWPYTNAEDVADAVLRDMLNGVDPMRARQQAGDISQQKISDVSNDKTLMGVHNISEEKLKKALKLGGLANPSMAVIDTKNGIHTDYGEISLIPRSSLIDAKTGRNAGTYAGDAWTPTYPSVTKEMTSKGEKHKNQIAKEAAGGNEQLEQHLARTMERYVDDNENRLHLLYLLQKGIKPDLIPESTIHTHDEYEALRKILGNDQLRYSSDGLTKEQNDAILEMMMKGVREKAEMQAKLITDEEQRQKAIDAVVKLRKDSLVDPETGKIWFAKYDTYIYDVLRDEKRRQNPKIDWYKTDNEASYRVAKENLAEDYEAWKEQLFGDEDIAEKLFAGWTPDGYKKYVKNTVANASRLMNKEKDTNAYGNGGLSASKAMLVKKLKSLAEIRKYRHLIKKGDDIKEQLKQKESEWFDIIEQVSQMQKVDSNPFINNDIAEARLQEAMEQRDPIAYMNKEYGYHIDKNGELASQLMNFMEEASQMPVKYFETKFKRPVGLEEFAIAVVPTNTSPEVIKALEDKGLEVHTYEKGSHGDENDEARKQAVMDAVRERDDIMFQKVTDKDELDKLNSEPTVKRYRAMQLIDGKLYPPMSAKVDGAMREPTEIGVWEKAEERPDLVKNGKFVLNKAQKGQGNVPAAYNPYFHTSTSGLNDQFTSAYKRPELVVVEVEIPESELTSGYKAEGAKDAVGNVDWHSGVVNGQLPADRQRQVTLSRYSKVNRVVPDSEVADMIAKQLEGTNIEVPYNVVTPSLRAELEKKGVTISDKPAGSVTEDINGNPISKQAMNNPMSLDFPSFQRVRKMSPQQLNEAIRKKNEERLMEIAEKRAAEEGGIKKPNRAAFEKEAAERYAKDYEAWMQAGGKKKNKPNPFDYTGDTEYRKAYNEYLVEVAKYKPEETLELTKDDVINEREMQTRTPAQKITKSIATTLARDYDGEQASDAVREGVIERRRNIEELSADDSIYINNLREQTDSIAKEISGDRFDGDDAVSRLMNEIEARRSGKQHISGKDIRDALPFIIEAPMRRNDIARDINDALRGTQSPVRVMGEDIKAATPEIDNMRSAAYKLLEVYQTMKEEDRTDMTAEEKQLEKEVKELAGKVADAINRHHTEDMDQPEWTADDVLATLDSFIKLVVPKNLKVDEDMPELQAVINGIRDWYRTAYTWLDEAGMRKENVGFFENYVNHVWDKKRSDPDSYEEFVVNRQPTTSRNMKQRQVRTYMEGIEAGLVPQFTDITDMMGDYSKKNILAWANKKMLKDLSFIDVIERNEDGEVSAIFPMMSSVSPGLYGLDKYEYYEVPGVGTLWVYKDASKNFSQVFEQYKVGKAMRIYDNMASMAKKIELSWSGFHAGALSEVYAVQNSIEFGPKKTAQYFYKYLINDCVESGLSPAYANADDYRSAAKHFVKLGATDDYSASAIQNMSDTMVNFIKDVRNAMKQKNMLGKAGSLGIKPIEVMATAVKFINEGSDKVLWTWLHDGLKIATFKMMEDRTNAAMEARFLKKHPEMSLEDIHKLKEFQTELNKQLDRDGQYVNDMFGGQHWELINISPKTLRYMRRLLLSPDWLISTQRHFLGSFGYGDIHSKARLRDFSKFLSAIKGEKAEFDENSLPGLYAGLIGKGAKAVGMSGENIDAWAEMELPRGRMRRALSSILCYAIGCNIFYDIANNIVNAIMRKWDEEDEERKEKENQGYVSKYKLMYPDGMKWFDRKRLDWNPMHMFGVTNYVFGDYGMQGNALGKKTHVFGGHYDEGAEVYLRTGKQFKEFPDFWENEKGELEFPRPLVNRLMGKANPNIRMIYNLLNYYTRWDKAYDDKQLEERIKKFSDNKTFIGVTAGLTKLVENYMPFWVPTQNGKNWIASDMVFPSSKGFSPHKAREFFEQFMRAQDEQGYMETVRACVMNGMTDDQIDKAIKSAKNAIQSEIDKRNMEGTETLQEIMESFDATTDLSTRKKLNNKIRIELGNQVEKAPKTYDEFQQWYQNYLEGADEGAVKANEKYIERAEATDMVEEARISQLEKQINAVKTEMNEMNADGASTEEMGAFVNKPENKRIFKAEAILKAYRNGEYGYNAIKKQLGQPAVDVDGEKHDDKWRMQKIRSMRKEMIGKIGKITRLQ